MATFSGSGSSKSNRWTMVDSKGEIMPDGSMSESSDSSIEVVDMEDLSVARDGVPGGLPQSGTQLEAEENLSSISTNQPKEDFLITAASEGESTKPEFDPEGVPTACTFPNESLEGTPEASGACCAALFDMERQESVSQPGEPGELSNDANTQDGISANDVLGSQVSSNDNAAMEELEELSDEELEESPERDSDSDSDFVQINEDNLEEFEAAINRSRNGNLSRSPSIAEGFHFLVPQGVIDREILADRLSDDEDVDDDVRESDGYEDFNEDTESSTEDAGDDRIESDQSDVGSVHTLTDVGDLSSFADIGDLPLVVGDVARNYCHRPNNRISAALNVTLVVVSLLTMGISIGLIMATDLEMEEWQKAYAIQVKKVTSLEWTLADTDHALQDFKTKVNAYESVLKSFNKLVAEDNSAMRFFDDFAGIVQRFDVCTRSQGRLSVVECHAQLLPDIKQASSIFKGIPEIKKEAEDLFWYSSLEREAQHERVNTPNIPSTKKSSSATEELQQSLDRERERALRWQNLYLLERRQREWERENEDLEDKREREKWEQQDKEEDQREREMWVREDEEQDRKEREMWVREDEEEDRKERERWLKEEEENDRKERLLWEEKDREEDRKEREQWEAERKELDNLACLKKLINTNLTDLKQQMSKLNISSFNRIVNMTSLRTSISGLKRSVLVSVQQIWTETEEAMKKMGDDLKNKKQTYFDSSMMTDYLKQVMSVLQSHLGNMADVDLSQLSEIEKEKDYQQTSKRNDGENEKIWRDEEVSKASNDQNNRGVWNKVIGKVFKKTSKSLRKFVRKVKTSWHQVKRKVSGFMHSGKKTQAENTKPFPSWVRAQLCRQLWKEKGHLEEVIVGLHSPCLWELRDEWHRLVLQEPCTKNNQYSLACNNNARRKKQDFKVILERINGLQNDRQNEEEKKSTLHLFEEFWKSWGDSSLMLQVDKDWVHCQLKLLSQSVVDVTKSPCYEEVNVKTVLKEFDSKKTQNKLEVERSWDPVHSEQKVDVGQSEMQREGNVDICKKPKGGHQIEDGAYDNGDHESSMNQNGKLSEDRTQSGNVCEVQDEKTDSPMRSYNHESNMAGGFDYFDGITNRNDSDANSIVDGENDEDQILWYLKRAQHRLEMRRSQEKGLWYFGINNHEESLRQEHGQSSSVWLFEQARDRENQRKKSHESDWLFDQARNREAQRLKEQEADWLFDLGHDREDQRKRSQESDWLFERATHRRQEFVKKWRQNSRNNNRKYKDGKSADRRQKIKDLRNSEWLVQENKHFQDKMRMNRQNMERENPNHAHGRNTINDKAGHSHHQHPKEKHGEKLRQVKPGKRSQFKKYNGRKAPRD